ncbi:DUF4232 domain-containing protein [Saccharopolyspora antimicrobica]|uniref:DUF4232 domain-containing protein n=1 Tax=Saccharopolyspora antimicrobica TaxID=455193 RepID=UPI001FEBD5FD|nr:DUF4232 domain-containing protein [Saccharopolyspora antimicrobica]
MKSTPATLFGRAGVLLAGVAVLAACTGPEPSPPPEPAPTSEPAGCPESGVEITAGQVDTAMFSRAMGIVMTNCGTGEYTVNGFPVVRVLDADQQPLDIAVGNGSRPVSAPDSYDAPPEPVTLRPGEQVTARVLWRNEVTSSTEAAVTGRYLEIAPAEGEPAQVVEPDGGVDLGTTGRLAVNAWAVR